MALYRYIIYPKSDFEELDFNGTATTKATLNPIQVIVEDDDNWLGNDDRFSFFFDPGHLDTPPTSQIVASSNDLSIGVGTTVALADGGGSNNTLTDGDLRIVNVAIDGNDDYVLAIFEGRNTVLAPSTSYTETSGSGQAALVYASSALPVCFAAGSLIATPDGPIRAGDLAIGGQVSTAENGAQTIRWIGRRRHLAAELARDDRLRPVRIAAGAMGNGLPGRDLWVSRQHRLLVRGPLPQRMFAIAEVLVPAIKLAGLPGIGIDHGAGSVSYVHILCDRHEVLFAEGCPAESLYLGPMVRNAVETGDLGLLPAPPVTRLAMVPARMLISGRSASQLRMRLAKNATAPLHAARRRASAA